MTDKVAVICVIALVRALGSLAEELASTRDKSRTNCRETTAEIVAELQELGNRL